MNRARIVGVVAVLALVGVGIYLVSTNDPPSERVVSGAGGSSGDGTPTTNASMPLSEVAWSSAAYPVDCGGPTSGSVATYASPRPGTDLAIVLVTCVGGNGSPPSAVLVYDGATSAGEPHLRQTLVRYQDDWIPKKGTASAKGSNLSLDVVGYSDSSVTRCCPDIETTLSWSWNGTEYVAKEKGPQHSQLPDPTNG